MDSVRSSIRYSAWTAESDEEAGGTWARVWNAMELGLGGLTSGTLTTNRGFEHDSASPSMLLSPDVKLLAFVARNLERGGDILHRRPCGAVEVVSFDGRTLEVLEDPISVATLSTIDPSSMPHESGETQSRRACRAESTSEPPRPNGHRPWSCTLEGASVGFCRDSARSSAG